ncbi:S41 family peptidase [Patescibacteria group bacterium]|nr:S41 family peptidase [Patescibacteria group bacterium]
MNIITFMSFIKKSTFVGGLVVIVISVFIAGVFLGYNERPEAKKVISIFNKENPAVLAELDFDSFWKIWNVIESKYVSNNVLDRKEMLWGATAGLVKSLGDPYSVFFSPEEADLFESSVRGDFEGVGMEIGIRDDILTVIAPLKDTPAERAGLKSGDKILKIDDVVTNDMGIDEAVRLIRGEKGTEVALSVLRKGEEGALQVSVVRDVIKVPALETERKTAKAKDDGGVNDVFVIHLYNFSASSIESFRNALGEMVNSGESKLIIDLRGNTGGYLEAAVDIASWFLPAGEIVAKERFNNGEEHLYRSKGYNIFNDNLKLVILVNQGTASASEILAGALREHGKATLVGEQTYGKGSVQELVDIRDGSALKLTIARWLTPNGESISEKGLEPDVVVEFTKEDLEAERDPQMDRALEILSKM